MNRLSKFGRASCALAVTFAASSASAATLPAGFIEQTFSGITNPTAISISPDGRAFVSQQCGALRVIKNGTVLSTPFATLSVNCANERGLHSVAFDPDFATNGYVYVRYTRADPQNNVIGRLKASATNPDVSDGTVTVIFTIPYRGNIYHHGGGIVVGNDGKIYSSIGDHQSSTSAQSLGNLWGKVVRINTDGSIPTDNPFYTTTTGDNRAIWAYGFRNPFMMAIQPGTGRIHVNDVGNSAGACCEEVNHLTRSTNYDWPNSLGSNDYYGYTASSQGGNAIVGGTFYNPAVVNFPSSYVGRYFFGDYGGGWIRSIMGSGTPGSLTGFASGISGPTDVETNNNDGTVWYTARNSSNVRRICYQTCGVPPITPTPTPTHTPTPIGPTPTPTATPRPNLTPSPTISLPADESLYSGGQTINFAGSCTDPEDGPIPPAGLSWSIVFHHQTHTHPGFDFPGTATGSFVMPTEIEWDPIQYWNIELACSDTGGHTSKVSVQIRPKLQPITVASSPSGAQVSADGLAGAAPITGDAVVNTVRTLDAGAPQSIGGVQHFFEKWSDGAAKRHDITMPDAPTTYTATFRAASAYQEITPSAANVTASTSDSNLPGNVVDNDLATRWSGNGDGAWLQLDLGSVKTIGHVGVAVYQGNTRRNRFDIQLSADGTSWANAFQGESSGTTTAEQMYDFADAPARYVRYLGHGNVGTTNPTMNSVTEISVFGTAVAPNTIVIGSMTYTPSTLTVDPGTTVTWYNGDTIAHTATSDTGAFDSGTIDPGASWSFTFNTGGSYPYHCSFHPGMTGTVVVSTPPPTPTPTSTPEPTPTPTPTTPVPPTPTPTPGCSEVTPAGSGVTASTHDGNLPANVVDNSLASRWSANGDGQWIQLDLGATYTVSSIGVAVYNGNARQNIFDLQVSDSATGPWTTVFSGRSSGTTTAEESYDIVDTPARYVRYLGHMSTVNTFNSVTEISVFSCTGVPPVTPTPTNTPVPPTPTPTSTPIPPTPTPTPTPGCMEITPPPNMVTASTSDSNLPGNVVDNDLTTRWSGNGDGAWLQLDLGSTQTISYVTIAVYNGNARQNIFDLVVSTSSTGPWTTVFSGRSSGTTTAEEVYDIADVSARYLRYVGHGSTVGTFNSVTEISIFSCTGPTVPPTPTPTMSVTPTPTPTPGTGPLTPVAINGQLRVCGNRICNQYGQPIQLRGMSTHGLQWYPDCIDSAAPMDALVNDWQADILRVSMYVQEGGYETDPAGFTALADRIIDRAIARGIYVTIDWHQLSPGDPMYNLSRARTYFTHMTQKYGHLPNVIYEICNEPSGVTWARIRDYAIQINQTIRANDPDNIILVGTRAWSSLGLSDGMSSTSGPNEVINNPVPGTNLAYVFHMYAASHLSEYQNALSYAADRIPMWVTEWGTQTFTGDGGNNFTSSQVYVDLMRTKKISWTNWNWSDDSRSGAVFTAGTCPAGPYAGTTRLKAAGVWIRDRIRMPADDWPTAPTP